MLCLSLKSGEWMSIGAARVKIERVDGQNVRLVIDAPKEIRVLRDNAGKRRRQPKDATDAAQGRATDGL
jgi:carbon storage regulator CsrA